MKYARKPAQQLTPGDDQPETPCAGKPEPFDVLGESSRGENAAAWKEARAVVQRMCGTCMFRDPERATACLDAAKGQRWRAAILGKSLKGNVA